MKRSLGWTVIVLVVLGGVWAATAWPRLNDVETGRTPEYPDLQVRTYAAPPARVAEALKQALARLPRWRVVGSGQGPGGTALTAVHETRLFRFEDDVTVRIRQDPAGGTTVSVRSQSRVGKWDFGQNARNIRELLAALDAELL
jgi:uncharacterized protein (DUF1499 family)